MAHSPTRVWTRAAKGTAAFVTALVAASPLFLVQPAAAASPDDVHGKPSVTRQAWKAGAATFGAHATPAQAVEAFWTPDRMRAAIPIEESAAYRAAVAAYTQAQAARAAQGGSAGSAKSPQDGPVRSVAPREGTVASTPVPAAHNPNYSYWEPTARTSGKVFFTMGNSNYACSATIVNSEGRDTVWTAGHCVHGGQGGAWASNWQFVPAYDDDLADPRPYGTWTARDLWTKTAWARHSDFSADMGVAIMNPRAGNHIVDYLGAQGLRVNAGKRVYEYAFGYPAEAPFDGGNLYRCQGRSSPEWDIWFWWSETIKISCDMTRGSSGGGWLNGWNGQWGYLNGVNSRIDRIVGPTIMLSPYFDSTAWGLYNSTRHL